MSFENRGDVKTMRQRPTVRAVLLVAGLVLAGCSSDKGQATSSTSEVTTTSVAPATTQEATTTTAAPTTTQEATTTTEAPTTTQEATTTTQETTSTLAEQGEYVGGCAPFTVYAQNEYPANPDADPTLWVYGAAARSEPASGAQFILAQGFPPNDELTVIGWIDTTDPAFPTNKYPLDSPRYYEVIDDEQDLHPEQPVWVSYPGVRNQKTEHADPQGEINTSLLAQLPTACEITFVQP